MKQEIRGKWSKLKGWQKGRLIYWAINKDWKMYWYMKEIWLSVNEKES